MTKISINGKTYAVVASDLTGGKTSCEQCAFLRKSQFVGAFCDGAHFEDCETYDTEETHYHFEEVHYV